MADILLIHTEDLQAKVWFLLHCFDPVKVYFFFKLPLMIYSIISRKHETMSWISVWGCSIIQNFPESSEFRADNAGNSHSHSQQHYLVMLSQHGQQCGTQEESQNLSKTSVLERTLGSPVLLLCTRLWAPGAAAASLSSRSREAGWIWTGRWRHC